MTKQYKFKGFDWTELGECWGIKQEEIPFPENSADEAEFKSWAEKEFEAEEKYAQDICGFIRQHLCAQDDFSLQVEKDLRRFIHALIRQEINTSGDLVMWKALLKIEDPFVLAGWVSCCIRRMWT